MLLIGYYIFMPIFQCVSTTSIENRMIIGGDDANVNSYPFVVFIQFLPSGACTGSVIGEEWILTAAHCLENKRPFDIVISTETSKLSGGVTRNVQSVFLHPQYDNKQFDYDCGLIKLTNKMIYNNNLKPIKLSNINEPLPIRRNALVLGFGQTNVHKRTLSDLKSLHVPILEQNLCKKFYSRYKFTKRMFCAGIIKGGKDTCRGDSGGPLILDDTRIQIGITSFGEGCAEKHKPGIYTYIGNRNIRSFIKKVANV